MLEILLFRIILLLTTILALFRFGDWKNIDKYYPTMLFVMVVNLSSSLLTYHHPLWNFTPDYLVKTYTVVEMLNTYISLPSTAFIFLSNYPSSSFKSISQYAYIGLWIFIYSTIEWADYIVGGISYHNGWSWQISIGFDFALFSFTRIHYSKPIWAWALTFLLGAIILVVFNFSTAEMK
jgi:hypothetical protein